MNRVFAAAVLVSTISLGLVACGDEHHGHGDGMGGMGGSAGTGRADPGCSAYATCDTCTPVMGCGWCFQSDGTGACTTGADRCAGQEFAWTWEPAGCGTSAPDGGVSIDAPAPSDALATEVTPTDAAPAVDGTPADDVAPAVDAAPTVDAAPACNAPATGTTACVQTTGGSLCGATEATVACHGASPASTPAPATAAGCRPVSGPSGSGAVFYCCPCAK
jgi:hypothetical protein